MSTTEQTLAFAVEAIKRSEMAKGKAALARVLQQEPDNVVAWLWLSDCLEQPEARRECLRRVSALNPFK
jgi:hypothetical protein